jgi:CelD/BcsL family acetyltransferase involved in cellulose biosynthesis
MGESVAVEEGAMLIECEAVKVARARPMTGEVMTGGVEVIERLGAEWRALCAEGPNDEPFYRPEFIAAWVRAFAPDKRLVVVTARKGGQLRAVLPLVERWGSLRGLPVRMLAGAANVHSCRFDVIRGLVDADEAVELVWRMLRERGGWDVIELREVPHGGAGAGLLKAAARDGRPTGRWGVGASPYLPLGEATGTEGEALDRLLAQTAKKFRKSLSRSYRQLSEAQALTLTCIREAEAALESFYRLEGAGWKGRKGTAIACDGRTRRFYDGLAQAAAREGYFALYALEWGGRAVAMQYCLSDRERCYLLKPTYDETLRKYSPGQLITREVLRDCLARGVTEYDFLGREAEWKGEWTEAARPQADCYIFRRGLAGQALHAWKFRVLRRAREVKWKVAGWLAPYLYAASSFAEL